jgi:diguanylate cyclase (GGDEF)-like protein
MMSRSIEEFRSQTNRVLRSVGGKLAGICFIVNEERSISADRGVDMEALSRAVGDASKKMCEGRLVLKLQGAGGRLVAAFSFKDDSQYNPERVSGLLSSLLNNLLLQEERDRDGLTGFLKKEAFRDQMIEMALRIKTEAKSPGSKSSGRKPRSPSLSFFHLDLDHFKEVNDTLGHRFGDEVLRSFARQVRSFFSQNESGEALLARLGGEEFGVLLAYLSASEARSLGQQLCEFVRRADIPTAEELEAYRRLNPEFKSISLPQVTVSVGIATADSAVVLKGAEESLPGELDQLYERADVATYVAKKLGRDRVMAFERILAEGGTVIDYDERTGIITLDLGNEMEVDVGDVFRVYDNQKFTGKEPIIQPGSQNKVIGHYPRLVLGEIEVIMCHPQVSFATRREGDTFIPAPGFFLEWVPPSERGKRGSGDRRRRDRKKVSGLAARSIFEARLRESLERERFILVLFFFDNLVSIREQRGSSTLKELYRSLAAELEKISVPGDVVSAISSEFMGFLPASSSRKSIVAKIADLERNFASRDKATFSAVLLDSSTAGFERSRALQIARKGAEIARFKGTNQTLALDARVLFTKLFFYHEHGEYDKVADEFQQLHVLGLSDEGALLYYAEALSYLGRLEEAVDKASDILKKDKHNLTAMEVLASSTFELGRYREAAQAYESLSDEKKGKTAAWQWRDFGIALLYLGEVEKALGHLERALADDATDASAIYHKGEALMALGKNEKARADFMRAFELGYRELSPQAAKLLGQG